MAVPLHQVGGLDAVALVKPVSFLVGQRAFEEIARAVKAQDRQAALLGTTARRRHVVKQELFAQYRVDGFGQGGPLSRAQRAVIAEVARNDRIGGVLKPQGERNELGTGVEQGFRMHARIVPPHLHAP